jgi:uncharacterized Zn-binding protein involved in type VI secretion|tara:strand:- start:596 stop:895 length:300 start_codon:yes stop_codon:yes gene_type:complete
MPAVSRHRIDLAITGHTCTFKAPVFATQFTVFANGRPMLRPGDQLKPHKKKKGDECKFHKAEVHGSSRSVFAENIPVARAGDKADKGSCTSTSNVFAGG